MGRLFRQLASFLKAEEVPRWFGLSLVLIYLVGLATVANVGIVQARRNGGDAIRDGAEYALELVGDRIARLDMSDPEAFAANARRELRNLAAALPVETASLVENGRVVVAVDPSQEGARAGDGYGHVTKTEVLSAVATTTSAGGWRFRVPVVASEIGTATDHTPLGDGTDAIAREPSQVPMRHIDAVVLASRRQPGLLTTHAGALSIVLVALGALLVTYRCVREQMRGVARIAARLGTHGDRIREELASLRIADTVALDGVTAAWNELVDLAQSLSEQVRHNEADAELCSVLRNSPGSALADALHVLPDGLVHIAEEQRLEYANATACRLMQWDAKEVVGAGFPDAVAEGAPKRIVAIIRDSLQPDGTFLPRNEIVETDVGADGSSSSIRVWIIPIRRQRDGGGCMVVIRDVSQQLKADKAREEFITQVTHELRTPLTNIRAYAETLSSGMFDDPNVITECYNVITKETRRLSRLIEDILSVSQLEVGSIELALDSVDLSALLTEAVRDVRGLADEKQIDLQLVLPSKLEPIRGDRDKLAVVVNNLLGNAIKYTPDDGTVLVGCQIGNHEVMITVKDNGIGIDPAEHGRVFEKFQRGTNPEVRQETGTGIGLYTAREIVRRHGGDIELISAIGTGSTFMVRLPQRASRSSSMSTAAGA